MNPNPSCPGDIISYYPNEQFGINYLWNFGDGYTSSLKNPYHQYASVGTYTVTHMVTNFCNLKDTDTLVMNVNGSLPIFLSGNMNAWPMPACPTQPVQFNANNWGFALYAWNFGDGTVDSTNYPSVMHSYTAAGTYTASVNISNNCGSDSMIFLTVNIATAIPFPNFTLNANPQIACPDQTVNLNAPWGYPSYSWNMGDGSPVLNTTTEYISYSYTTTGSYPVSVKVTDFCNRDTTYRDTISVVNASTFCLTGGCSINHWANNPSCPNQSVSFNADPGYAWYEWLFGDGSSMATSNSQTSHTYTATGVYNYSLTITNFCGVDTTVYNSVTIDNTMQVPPWVNIYANPDVACPGHEIQFTTDNSYNSYFWNFGDGYSAFGTANVTHTYTAAAVYNVSVTITNACGNATTISNSVNINVNAAFPNWMNLSNSPDPSCPNSPVMLETLPGYVSYNWHFGDGDSLISSTGKVMHVYTAPGIYHASVEVTNSCGNSVTLYKTVTINSNVTISYVDLFIPANPACVGDVVFMNAGIGGPATAGITFVWNFGDGSPQDTTVGVGTSHTYTAMGVYNVSVTAFNACGNSKSNSKIVTINNTSVPYLNPWTFGVLTESGQPVSAVCPGDILVFYFEGINSNNLWNFGDGYTANAIDLFVRADGMTITTVKHAYVNTGSFNYSLTLGNNCGNNSLLSKSINVTGNMLINGGFMIEPPTSSLGYTTCGLIDFVAFGGNDFDWDFGDGDTLSTISPTVGHSYVNPGNYTVRVTITNGCGNSATYVKTLTISGQGGTSVNSNSSSPTCFGGANGSATAVVSGGQAPYTYIWYNSLNQPISSNVTATGLSAGTYVVSVTDANGCTGSSVSVLNNPAAITFSTSSTQSTCGGASGTATVSGITGGSGPYSYAWTNGQTASTATGLAMGNYGVVITDANSCTSSGNASVSENGAVVSLASATNATCNASTNGSISINVTSGTPPYTFAWSNSATTQNISGIAAGNYSVVVTDSAGCLSTLNGSVTAPAAISVNVTPVVSPTCGNFDGSAIANVSGGVSPYSYFHLFY